MLLPSVPRKIQQGSQVGTLRKGKEDNKESFIATCSHIPFYQRVENYPIKISKNAICAFASGN